MDAMRKQDASAPSAALAVQLSGYGVKVDSDQGAHLLLKMASSVNPSINREFVSGQLGAQRTINLQPLVFISHVLA
jgi:hypothetical protein